MKYGLSDLGISTLHTWTLHPCNSVIKEKNPQCCEEFGQVAFCLVHLWSYNVKQSILETWRTQGQRRLLFWHERRVMESPPLLPHLLLIRTWQQWCARGCRDGSPLCSRRVLFWRMGDGGGLAYFTSLFSNGVLLCLPFPIFFFIPHRGACQ